MPIEKKQDNLKVYLVSLGCDKNLVDGEIMLGLIGAFGLQPVPEPDEAQVIVVNTCGFIGDAVQESIDMVLAMAAYKKDGICQKLIVTGCMAQRYRDQIFEQLPEVDALVGVNDFGGIAAVIRQVWDSGEPVTALGATPLPEHLFEYRAITAPMHMAYVKIAEGCDNRCTYCAIPGIRGAYRSRSSDSILQECRRLADRGVKELVLVAQDTARYGAEIDEQPKLHLLLDELSRIDGIEWIRILYAYPDHITPALVAAMRSNPKVCPYLDMPIQHCHDDVLKRMGRTKSTEAGLRALIARLREQVPGLVLRTTLIVGFPGETEAEFDALYQFVKDIQFDRLGVFMYAKESDTPAARMKPQIKKAVKKARMDALMRLQKRITAEKQRRLLGETLRVIVDGQIPDPDEDMFLYCGRSYRDTYEIDGCVYFTSDETWMSGDMVDVRVTEAYEYDVQGVVADESAE